MLGKIDQNLPPDLGGDSLSLYIEQGFQQDNFLLVCDILRNSGPKYASRVPWNGIGLGSNVTSSLL